MKYQPSLLPSSVITWTSEDEIVVIEKEGRLSEYILLNDKIIRKENINQNQFEEIIKKYFSNIESNYDFSNVSEIVKEYYSDKFNLSSDNCLKNINEAKWKKKYENRKNWKLYL